MGKMYGQAHRGEVSFPGGALDASEAAEDAALREAHEEIGLAKEGVQVWTHLKPLATRVGPIG